MPQKDSRMLKVPGLRAYIGDWVYYTTSVRLRDVAERGSKRSHSKGSGVVTFRRNPGLFTPSEGTILQRSRRRSLRRCAEMGRAFDRRRSPKEIWRNSRICRRCFRDSHIRWIGKTLRDRRSASRRRHQASCGSQSRSRRRGSKCDFRWSSDGSTRA